MNTKSVPTTVTFRHIAPTDALRSYAEKKLKSILRLFPGVTDAHVILSANNSHRHRQSAEIIVHGAHSSLTAIEETDDLYAAIDLALRKLDSQVRKLKERVIQAPRRNPVAARRPGPSTPHA